MPVFKKPNFWKIMGQCILGALIAVGGVTLCLIYISGHKSMSNINFLVVMLSIGVVCGAMFGWLMWGNYQSHYEEDVLCYEHRMLLTYRTHGTGEITTSEVYPRNMYMGEDDGGEDECRMSFIFYDNLDAEGYPEKLYIKASQFIKIERLGTLAIVDEGSA